MSSLDQPDVAAAPRSSGDRARPEVTVVVVTWERRDLVLRSLESLRAQTVPHRVVVVDNASHDGTAAAVREAHPGATVVELEENRGFAGGVVAAMDHVHTRFVALLNNDAVAEPRWLESSLAVLEDSTVAAVTAKMVLDQPGPSLINNAGVVLLPTGYGADRGLGQPDGPEFDVPAEVFAFSGGAVVMRTLAAAAVGGFAADWFLYYEDTDLSWRLRLAGWRIVFDPGSVVRHAHGASSDPSSAAFAFYTERNRLLTLWADAPLSFAVRCSARFVLTTASLSASRLRKRQVPDHAVFDSRLRLSVLRATTARLPALLLQRRGSGDRARRRALLRDWAGVESRPLAGVG